MGATTAAVTLLAAVLAGLMGGVFFAFSVFIMRGLARLPAARGIGAMQAINIAVIRPLFLVPFLGNVLPCAFLAWIGVRDWSTPWGPSLASGSILYVVAVVLVTIAANVPMNDALAKVDANAPGARPAWEGYLRRWTLWNHARTIGGFVSAALLTWALSVA